MSRDQALSKITAEDAICKIKEMMGYANILFLDKPELKFIGILAYSLHKEITVVEIEDSKDIPPFLAYTNSKKIKYVINTKSKHLQENNLLTYLLSTTIHEMLHVISDHCNAFRVGYRDPNMWNLACDHVVNSIIYSLSLEQNTKNVKLLTSSFFIEELYNQYKHKISPEQVYDILNKRKDSGRYKMEIVNIPMPGSGGAGTQGQPGNGSGDGEGDTPSESNDNNDSNSDNNSSNNSSEVSVIKITDTKTGKVFYEPLDTDMKNTFEELSDDELQQQIDKLKSDASLLWSNEGTTGKGNMPGDMLVYFEQLFKVEVPWHVILENALMYSCQNKQDTTWTWPNDIIRSVRLPGSNESMEPDLLLAVVDASGSVGDQDLIKFISILCDSYQFYENLKLIVHDHRIQDNIDVNELSSRDQIFDRLKKFMGGRGGTSHQEPFDYIESIKDSYNISSIIFLTDFESDVEHIYKKYEWTKEFETIWILNTNYEVDLDGMESTTIHI